MLKFFFKALLVSSASLLVYISGTTTTTEVNLLQTPPDKDYSACIAVIFPHIPQLSSASHLLEHGIGRLWWEAFTPTDFITSVSTTFSAARYTACQRHDFNDTLELNARIDNFFDKIDKFQTSGEWVQREKKRIMLEEAETGQLIRYLNFQTPVRRSLEQEKALVYTRENAKILLLSDDTEKLHRLKPKLLARSTPRDVQATSTLTSPLQITKDLNSETCVISEYTFETSSDDAIRFLASMLRKTWILSVAEFEQEMQLSVQYDAQSKTLRVYLEGGPEDALDTTTMMILLQQIGSYSLQQQTASQLLESRDAVESLQYSFPIRAQLATEVRKLSSGVGRSAADYRKSRNWTSEELKEASHVIREFQALTPSVSIHHDSAYEDTDFHAALDLNAEYASQEFRAPLNHISLVPKTPYTCTSEHCYKYRPVDSRTSRGIEYVQLRLPTQLRSTSELLHFYREIYSYLVKEQQLYTVHFRMHEDAAYAYFTIFEVDRKEVLDGLFSEVLLKDDVRKFNRKDFSVTIHGPHVK